MNRALRRLAVAAAVSGAIVLAAGGAAGAAEPEVQGCYGESISALARGSQGAFGASTVNFAQNFPPPGLGDGVQLLQAGQVPDFVVPNTCNVDPLARA
jgi:hypothetical protein